MNASHKRNFDKPIPLDEYLELLKETFSDDIMTTLDLEEEVEIRHQRHRDAYTSGKSRTCTHCNTAFQSARRNPKCPFCHEFYLN